MPKSTNLSVGRGEKLSVSQGGGLTTKGRKKYNRATGSKLKAPTKSGPRHKSFCARSKNWKGERGKAARRRWGCRWNQDCMQTFTPSVSASVKVQAREWESLAQKVRPPQKHLDNLKKPLERLNDESLGFRFAWCFLPHKKIILLQRNIMAHPPTVLQRHKYQYATTAPKELHTLCHHSCAKYGKNDNPQIASG